MKDSNPNPEFDPENQGASQNLPDNDPGRVRNLLAQMPQPQDACLDMLEHLDHARHTALACDTSPTDYAVPVSELLRLGPMHLVRWLFHHGLINRPSHHGQSKADLEPESIASENHFVLSHLGQQVLKLASPRQPATASSPPREAAENSSALLPSFDSTTRVLKYNGKVVKRYRWAAKNQEALLAAFEAAGWPQRLPNPFQDDDKVDAKTRLHDTIKCLNRQRVNNLIRFRGDGSGMGVKWELETRPEKMDKPAKPENP